MSDRLAEIKARRQAAYESDGMCGAANSMYEEPGDCEQCDFYQAAYGDVEWLVAEVERLLIPTATVETVELNARIKVLEHELARTWEAVSNAPYDYCTAHVADVVTRELERLREALDMGDCSHGGGDPSCDCYPCRARRAIEGKQ